jgi:hypothetical protein
LPNGKPFEIAGDVVTQDGGRMLASVCGADLEPLKDLATNTRACEWGRSAAVAALGHVAAWNDERRESIYECFPWLATTGLEREPGAVWDSLAAESADIEARRVFPAIRRANAEGLVDPRFMAESELDDVDASPHGEELRRRREHWPLAGRTFAFNFACHSWLDVPTMSSHWPSSRSLKAESKTPSRHCWRRSMRGQIV